jgi:hypothetical protein
MECRHLDDDPANNRPDNLCWGTREENIADRIRNGWRSPLAKLTDDDVREIRAICASGTMTSGLLAAKFGVSRRTINHIVKMRSWKHVS